MRDSLARSIYENAKKDKELFLVVGDCGFGVFDNFKKDFSEQFLNTGINEAASLSLCAGLALDNKKAIYYNITPFVIMRAYEQLRNDICYQELPVICIAIGCGLTYAPAGMTHYSLEDLSLAFSMPNLDIFSPSDPIEAKLAFEYAYKSKKPSYIRVPKSGDAILHKNDNFDITAPSFYKKNNNTKLLIFHSTIAEEVMPILGDLDADVLSWTFVNTPNEKAYKILESYDEIFVLEEHFEFGGLGTFLAHKTKKDIRHIAIKNHYPHLVLNQKEYRKELKIDKENILNAINKN